MGYSETLARRPSDDPSHRLRQHACCQHRVFGPASHSPIAQSGPPRSIGRPSRTGGSAHRAAINSHSSLFKAWRDTAKHEVSAWIPPVTSARSRPVDSLQNAVGPWPIWIVVAPVVATPREQPHDVPDVPVGARRHARSSEAPLMAHGFPTELLEKLVTTGLAKASPEETRIARKRRRVVCFSDHRGGPWDHRQVIPGRIGERQKGSAVLSSVCSGRASRLDLCVGSSPTTSPGLERSTLIAEL